MSEPSQEAGIPAPGPSPIRWKHLSSANGDLPVPGNSSQQTAALILDIDRDGRNDFVIAARQMAPALVWYRRAADGWDRYVIEADYLTPEAGGAFYDIDGDGDLDLVMGGDSQSNKVWWWENPYPHFDPDVPWKRYEIKSDGANQHHDQLFGDFDGDGKAELVFWNQRVEKLFLARIPQDPKAGPWPYTEIFAGQGEGLAQGDIDGDGQIELLAGGRWFKHRRGMEFTPHVIDAAQTHPRLAVGDLNGDGRLEVVMAPGDGVGRLKWYECQGDPARPEVWVGHELLDRDVVHGHSLAIADFDGDGHLDIFCGEMAQWTDKAPQPDHPDARMWLFLGDGKGGFTRTEIATGFGVHEGKVGDLDGDGRPDILAKPYCWQAPRIDLWINERR